MTKKRCTLCAMIKNEVAPGEAKSSEIAKTEKAKAKPKTVAKPKAAASCKIDAAAAKKSLRHLYT